VLGSVRTTQADGAPRPVSLARYRQARQDEQSCIDQLPPGAGQERVAPYGQLDLTRDKAGPRLARELKAALDAVVHRLEAARDLPEQVPAPEPTKTVKNPFGS
jgi:hypothetical protein